MPGSLILLASAAFQILPFYQQKPAADYYAVRPLYAHEGDTTDVVWPVFTMHRDWWRFCMIMSWQDYNDEAGGYQFTLLPIWFNGRDREEDLYMGLFPVAGYHPHIGMMWDFKFALWPLWHQYKMPRAIRNADGTRTQTWMTTNAILFPFFAWRDDGAWSFWPLYGYNRRRESDHRYVLWPLITWAGYREDRDTSGDGYSWMAWPFYGRVRRERETQDLYLPPFFSFVETRSPRAEKTRRIRCPWPFVDLETTPSRRRISIWPFYERTIDIEYRTGLSEAAVTRFGWKFIELYDDETRVFPLWASGRSHFRLWPFYESETDRKTQITTGRFLSLMPIRWVPQIDRNWAKFWTFYENEETPLYTDHSVLWGIIKWRTHKE